jgi:hypothetical protein
MDRDKREFRQTKRKLKQLGSQRRRRVWKRELIERPDEAPSSEADFGRYSTADLNGRDRDATRRSRRSPASDPPQAGDLPRD